MRVKIIVIFISISKLSDWERNVGSSLLVKVWLVESSNSVGLEAWTLAEFAIPRKNIFFALFSFISLYLFIVKFINIESSKTLAWIVLWFYLLKFLETQFTCLLSCLTRISFGIRAGSLVWTKLSKVNDSRQPKMISSLEKVSPLLDYHFLMGMIIHIENWDDNLFTSVKL